MAHFTVQIPVYLFRGILNSLDDAFTGVYSLDIFRLVLETIILIFQPELVSRARGIPLSFSRLLPSVWCPFVRSKRILSSRSSFRITFLHHSSPWKSDHLCCYGFSSLSFLMSSLIHQRIQVCECWLQTPSMRPFVSILPFTTKYLPFFFHDALLMSQWESDVIANIQHMASKSLVQMSFNELRQKVDRTPSFLLWANLTLSLSYWEILFPFVHSQPILYLVVPKGRRSMLTLTFSLAELVPCWKPSEEEWEDGHHSSLLVRRLG